MYYTAYALKRLLPVLIGPALPGWAPSEVEPGWAPLEVELDLAVAGP